MTKKLNNGMRCIKRISVVINIGKSRSLDATIMAFNQEKHYWLNQLQQPQNMRYINQAREFRDQQVANGYISSYALQARQWKMALTEAAETMHKYWLGTVAKVRVLVAKNEVFNAVQKHYSMSILQHNHDLYQRLSLVLNKQIIEVDNPAFKDLLVKQQKAVLNYLLRKIKHVRRNYPRVKLARSMSLDANMYDVLKKDGKQYLSVMSLTRGKRIKVPLLGNTQGTTDSKTGKIYFGNIRIIKDKDRLAMHYSRETKSQINELPASPALTDLVGIDLGYTEVFVDSNSQHYGTSFGQLLQNKSDYLKLKNQKRNKIFQLSEKYARQNKLAKVRNIKKFNLGKIKYTKIVVKQNINSQRIINQAINDLIKLNPKKIIISEKLDKPIVRNLGKNWNRRLSSWLKGYIAKRIEFKALAEGFRHQQVNASYTSQTCPSCGYVDKDNRHRDKFECRKCRHEGQSDSIAAQNIANRYLDPEITLYTPYSKVKQILLARFNSCGC
jgi:putative transposase